MKDLVKVEDPDSEGGITLLFSDNARVSIRIDSDGKLVCESSPE